MASTPKTNRSPPTGAPWELSAEDWNGLVDDTEAAITAESAARAAADAAIIAAGVPVALSGSSFVYGPGPTARTLDDWMGDSVNVKNFEAVGDGVADDTAAIQAAIDYAAANGGAVVFPKGTYRITSGLTVEHTWGGRPISISGIDVGAAHGPNSDVQIVWDGAAGGVMLTVSGFSTSIRGVGFRGSDSALGCVYIASSPNLGNWYALEDLYIDGFYGAGSYGIKIGTNNTQVSETLIEDCWINGGHTGGVYGGETGILLGYANCKNHLVRRTVITSVLYGISATGGGSGAVSLYDCGFLDIFVGPNLWTAGGATYGVLVKLGTESLLLSNCWCETTTPALILDAPYSAASQFGVTLLGGYYLTGTPPANDRIMITLASLRCVGVSFWGGGDDSHIGSIQAGGSGSSNVYIEGCMFLGGGNEVPLVDGSGNSFSDPATATWAVSPRNNLHLANNIGGSSNTALIAMRNVTSRIDSPAAAMTGSTDASEMQPTAPGGGLTVGKLPTGRLSAGVTVLKVKYDHSKFTTNSSDLSIAVMTPGRHRLRAVYVEVTTPFQGGAIATMQMAVKDGSSDQQELIKLFDCKSAAIVKGGASADLGTRMAAAVQGGVLYMATGETISLRFVTTGSALGTGAATNLTQGEANVYFLVDRLDFA